MLDARLRPLIDPPLHRAALWLVRRGVAADGMTLAGFAVGMAAAGCIVLGQMWGALALICLNRGADGLDGAIARATRPTDRGGFLDITLDFMFYAAIPLAFAALDPAVNALAAAVLIASFLANGATFLAFAVVASKRGLSTTAQGQKAFFYMAGSAEGSETILVFCAFCLWPAAFPLLALGFAMLCAISAAGRLTVGWRALG